MQTNHLGRMVWLCLLVTAVVVPVRGQVGNQGSVAGTLLDQKAAAVPGAAVTLKNTGTGVSFTATSDDSGLFHFPVVPVGTYELTAEKTGFAAITQKDILVTVGAKLDLNLTLPLAAQVTSVEVTGQTPLLETTRTQVSATVNDRSVADLPVLGRNFIDFVLLTPGVTRDVRGGDISFAGQRGTLNSLIVDGSDNNNTFFGQTLGRIGSGRAPYQFSQDAVLEFQVNSNAYSAELGHAGGAVINVITKSGTNQFHGTAFEFYRDTSLNANDLINKNNKRAKSPLHFNQFGGNLGGPVVKDKVFFFFDYDGQRNTLPNLVVLNLPTNFTPANQFEQSAFNYLNARANSWTRTQDQDVYLGKVDWNISSRHLLTGRINSQRFTGANFENGGLQNAFEHTGASLVTTDTFSLSLTSTLTSSLLNVARFTYLRDNEPGQANSPNPEAAVFQPNVGLVLTVGRNFFSPRFTNIKRGEWSDTVSWTHGHHVFKFGPDFIVDRIGNFFPGNFSGAFTFTSLENFGRSLASTALVTGSDSLTEAFAGAGTSGPTTNPNLFEVAGFAQDEWRARSNLTLTLGLRYDVQLAAQPSAQNATALANGIDTSRIHNDHNGWEPRFGIAWTPLANNRMVVRGGYGLYRGRTPSIMIGTAHSNNGLNVRTLTFTRLTTPALPFYPNNICGAPDASPSCPAPTGGSASAPIIFVFDPDYKQPYVQQASLGVEYELARDFSVSVSYLGVKGTHLQRTRDINSKVTLNTITLPIKGGGTSAPFLRFSGNRLIPAFDRILQFEGSSSSIYHGVILQVTKRLSQNFQFLGSYTLGKVIDDTPDATAVVPGSFDDAKMVQYANNPHDDRAAGVNDQRHRFVLSGIWDLSNYAKGLPGIPRAILGGWEISGIFTAQSGQSYSGQVSADLNNDGNTRSDRTPGLARNTFRLPSTYSVDPRITKNIPITERTKFQLILEAFNVFNRANVSDVFRSQFGRSFSSAVCGTGVPECLVPQGNFGAPSLSAGPRIAQLAAKFIF